MILPVPGNNLTLATEVFLLPVPIYCTLATYSPPFLGSIKIHILLVFELHDYVLVRYIPLIS